MMSKQMYFIIFLVLMNIGCVFRLWISGNNQKAIIIFLIVANAICVIAYLAYLPDLSLHSWVEFFHNI